MKKIECEVTDEVNDCIDKLCEQSSYTRAEFNRRAINWYIDFRLEVKLSRENKIKFFLGKNINE